MFDAKSARAEVKAAKARAKALRPWYRKKRWWILAALGVLVLASIIGGGKKKTPSTAPTTSLGAVPSGHRTVAGTVSPSTAPPPTSQIGQTVKDGDFAFVVQGIQCGAAAAAAVNADGIGETVPPGAQECLVTMTVTDDKGTAQTFFDSNQYAYDAANHQFSADTSGSLFLSGSNDAAQVNPGITITAVVPFQIPATDHLVRLELHDSIFSGGVSANL